MRIKPLLLAGSSGLLLFFAFPNVLGIESGLLAWVALVPLLMAVSEAGSWREASLLAAVFGLAGYPVFYHWLVFTMHNFGGMSYLVSISVLAAMVLLLSCFAALFGAACFLLGQNFGLTPVLAAPAAWVATEFFRAHFPFGGFPWALMAYSQYRSLHLIQAAEFTGPYGISFVIVMTNACAASIVIALADRGRAAAKALAADPEPAGPSPPRRIVALAAWGLLPPLLLVAYGLVRVPLVDRAFSNQPEIKLGIVQANIDQSIKWSPDLFWETMQKHLDLTKAIMPEHPRLVLWPEAAVTISGFNEHWAARTRVIRFLSGLDAYFLVGSLSRETCGDKPDESGRLPACYFNSVYLLSPRAESLLGRYDKMRLVPFSEYVPLAKLFFFADAIAGGNTGSTTPGREVRVFGIPESVFGCVICYEVIFPHIVRRFVDEGAGFMTTITNDAWFGKTGAPYQHHSTVIFRAIENRVYFARSANTGISSIVDPVGRIVHQTPIYVEASFTGTVRPSPIKSFYTSCGDVFAWLVTGLVLVTLAYTIATAGRRRFEM